jgi:hypothetical protein
MLHYKTMHYKLYSFSFFLLLKYYSTHISSFYFSLLLLKYCSPHTLLIYSFYLFLLLLKYLFAHSLLINTNYELTTHSLF